MKDKPMSKLPRHPKDRGYGFLKACEYPETQSGIASFSMQELAEVIVGTNRRQHFTKEAFKKRQDEFYKTKPK